MAKGTPATLVLDRSGIAFTLHEYAYDPAADRVGLQAAEAMGVDPGCVLRRCWSSPMESPPARLSRATVRLR